MATDLIRLGAMAGIAPLLIKSSAVHKSHVFVLHSVVDKKLVKLLFWLLEVIVTHRLTLRSHGMRFCLLGIPIRRLCLPRKELFYESGTGNKVC